MRARHQREQRSGGPGRESTLRTWTWADLAGQSLHAVRRMASNWRLDIHVADDVNQEALLRLLILQQRGTAVRRPVNWLLKTARRMLLDIRRGRRLPAGPTRAQQPAEASSPETLVAHLHADPVRCAIVRESLRLIPLHVLRLPSPYREVARLQYWHGLSRRDISDSLQHWRPVSQETCRGIIRKTHRMLALIGEGESPRLRWPRRYRPSMNPWIATPYPRATRLPSCDDSRDQKSSRRLTCNATVSASSSPRS